MHQSAFPAPPVPTAWIEQLSPAEKRVMPWLGEGYSNKEISSALVRAEPTVRNHVVSILRKSGTPSRGRFVALYQKAVAASAFTVTPFPRDLTG